jgi:hypothetical protein
MSKGRPIEQVRAAKPKAMEVFSKLAEVNGVGITRVGDGYGLKVNLTESPKQVESLPKEVDGIPVAVEVIGPIVKRTVGFAGQALYGDLRRAR